ncbi:uncharacterized protein LOC120214977 [Hibiscus syriacus]|uniref:uncharacterized protein LOC120214977 n=1 Tax=Hibiscus syriacus TaxID=106335 RepID=UPI0019235F10|nr:uncharacterized protein LOC120214977 [Hibiscus syriacus]
MLQVTWIHHWSRLSKQRSIGVQPKGSGLILWILCQKQSLTICFLQTSEHQLRLQQEQFQTQELSRTLSQQLGMEGDIQLASSWSVDEVGPFVRNLLQAQSVGLNDSDLHRKRLSSFEEQFSNLKRNLALQEQQQQGTFEPNPTAFAWPALSALASGMEGKFIRSDEQYSTSPSEQQASNLPFNHLTDQEVNVNISFSEVPQNSGSFAEQSLILGSGDPFSSRYAGARLTAKFSVDKELLEGKEKKNGLKSMISRSGSVSGSEDNILEQVETTLNSGDLQSRTHLRHGSLSTGGNDKLYNNDIGLDKSVEDHSTDRLLSVMPKGRDKVSQIHHPRCFLIKTRCHS